MIDTSACNCNESRYETSYFNSGEVNMVNRILDHMTNKIKIDSSQIGIVTPYIG